MLGGFGSAFSGLASAAVIGLGLVLAAIGIQSGATVLGNDMVYRVRDHSALDQPAACRHQGFCDRHHRRQRDESRSHRHQPTEIDRACDRPIGLDAGTLLMLTLWPRATSIDATITLLVGLFVTELLIWIRPLAAGLDRFAISALVACLAGLAAGVLTSLIRGRGSPDGRTFTQASLSDSGEWLHPDKGV